MTQVDDLIVDFGHGHFLKLLAILSLISGAGPAIPCQLTERKAALAAAIEVVEKAGSLSVGVNEKALAGLEYQSGCAAVGAKYLASEDPIERAAAAVYGDTFKQAGEKKLNVLILSDFIGPITVLRYQRFFPMSRSQFDQALAHAEAETNPLVLVEQLRNFSANAGSEATLKLLRSAHRLVEASRLLRRDAEWFWRVSVPPQKLLPAELEAAWELGKPPHPSFRVATVDRSVGRRQRVEAALASSPSLSVYREASEVGLGDRVGDAVIAGARAFVAEKQGDCFFLSAHLEAGSGHLPTLLRLLEVLKKCETVFHSIGTVVDGLGRTPDPQAAVLASLPAIHALPKATCEAADALVEVIPAEGTVATYLTLARAFDDGGCLWRSADKLIDRFALMATDPSRQDEAIEGVVALGKLLAATKGGSELWRHGDHLVIALVKARTEKASAAIVELAILDERRSGNVQWAPVGEAALVLIGGPQADKRAAQLRRYFKR